MKLLVGVSAGGNRYAGYMRAETSSHRYLPEYITLRRCY